MSAPNSWAFLLRVGVCPLSLKVGRLSDCSDQSIMEKVVLCDFEAEFRKTAQFLPESFGILLLECLFLECWATCTPSWDAVRTQ